MEAAPTIQFDIHTLLSMDEATRTYMVKYAGLSHSQQEDLAMALSEIEAEKKHASPAPPAKKARPLLDNKEFVEKWKDLVGFNKYGKLKEEIMFEVLQKFWTKAGSHVEAEASSEELAPAGNICAICLGPAKWQFPQPGGKATVYCCEDDKAVVATSSKPAEGPEGGVLKWRILRSKLPGQEKSSEGTIAVRLEWEGSRSKKYRKGSYDLYLPFNAEGIVLLHMYEACWARDKILQIRQKEKCDTCRTMETAEVCRNCKAPMQNMARINLHFKSQKYGGTENHGYPDPGFFRYHAEMAVAGVFKSHIISESLRALVDRSLVGQDVA